MKLRIADNQEEQTMNVATITMPKAEAIRAYREFRLACKVNPTEQDQGVMMGLSALKRGQAVIDVREAIGAARLNELGFPKLAIARASWEWCNLYVSGTRRWFRFQAEPGYFNSRPRKGRTAPAKYVELACDIFAGEVKDRKADRSEVRAVVPYIPPSIRPGNPEHYHILWEAVWEPAPPTDPMLLRHLHGNLYAVLAVWDLTPLERAVMGQSLA